MKNELEEAEMKKSLITEELVVLQAEVTTLHYSQNQEVKLNAEALQQASETVSAALNQILISSPVYSRARPPSGKPKPPCLLLTGENSPDGAAPVS
jgi:hypothetical protein